MQTFLPYRDFYKCAECLDNKRLGKQRVEAFQILIALLKLDKDLKPTNKVSHWINHPAVKMWRGHERNLCNYTLIMCEEWVKRGFNSTMHEKISKLWTEKCYWMPQDSKDWMSEELCLSHQSNLIRKDPAYYILIFGPNVPSDLPYIWPNQKQIE